jgi:hypothetical protein
MESSKREEAALNGRKSEATSDETLSEIEDTEKDSASQNVAERPAPSPDGPVDEPMKPDDAGPM